MNRQAGEAERRRLRPQANREQTCGGSASEDGKEEQEETSPACTWTSSKNKSPNKPPKSSEAVRIACETHIDEVRNDDVHLNKWKHRNRAPGRASEFKVFRAVAHVHRKKPNQRIALRKSVQDVVQQPYDESDRAKTGTSCRDLDAPSQTILGLQNIGASCACARLPWTHA